MGSAAVSSRTAEFGRAAHVMCRCRRRNPEMDGVGATCFIFLTTLAILIFNRARLCVVRAHRRTDMTESVFLKFSWRTSMQMNNSTQFVTEAAHG